MRMRYCLLFALLVLAAGTAAAHDYPPVIKHMVKAEDFKVLTRFNAPAGLTGYAGSVHGHHLILYVTADGKHALAGSLFDAQGHNLTVAEADRYITKPLIASAWPKLENATWVAEGAKRPKRIVYEFVDPNCPYCHLFWLANQSYMAHGLQVRHILVGVITKSSMNKAAAILDSQHPRAAFIKNERDYKMQSVPENKAGGIAPEPHPKAKTIEKIHANNVLMHNLGVDGTPGIFYKDAKGRVQRAIGLPPLSKLPDMYRLPKQPIANPILKKYQ
jgi:thiol:disulfide interchange protein DsbG